MFEFRWESKPLGQPWHSLALALTSLVLMYGSIYFYSDSKDFVKKSIETKGEVIQLVEIKDEMFSPVVRFKDNAGKTFTFRSSSSSKPASYYVGEEVTVMYDPLFPENPRIKGFMDLWFFTVLLGGLSAGFLLAAIILWVFRHAIYAMSGYPELAGPNNTRMQSDKGPR